jgi:hypothetical protein
MGIVSTVSDAQWRYKRFAYGVLQPLAATQSRQHQAPGQASLHQGRAMLSSTGLYSERIAPAATCLVTIYVYVGMLHRHALVNAA